MDSEKRTKMHMRVTLAATFSVLLVTVSVHAEAIGTSFTYQGDVREGGTPVSGDCDFEFTLWDAAAGGMQIGPTLTPTVTVTDGVFTADLDFGVDRFQGSPRFLGIQICCPSACAPGYTPLNPRIELKPAPYALSLPALRNTPSDNLDSPHSHNVLGGHQDNSIGVGVGGGTIAGGGDTSLNNSVTRSFGTVGGGADNDVFAAFGTISGGGFVGTDPTCIGGPDDGNLCGSCVGGPIPGAPCPGEKGCLGGTCEPDPARCGDPGVCSLVSPGNRVFDNFGTVGGGGRNQAGADDGNATNAPFATVSGGEGGVARGSHATVGGGSFNVASGNGSTIGGGTSNQALAASSTIGGGNQNTTNGGGTIAGGFLNVILGGASSFNNTISGGQQNSAGGGSATISGGADNTANALRSTVGGGTRNVASGTNAVVAGGGGFFGGSPRGNTASNTSSTVGGGSENTASGGFSTVSGGSLGTAGGSHSTVSGGNGNTAGGNFSSLGGGSTNAADANYATVGGGGDNVVFATFGTISGGGFATTDPTCIGGPNDGSLCGSCVGGPFPGAPCPGEKGCFGGVCEPDPARCGAPGVCSLSTPGNRVYDDFGTIGGGSRNEAGSDDGNAASSSFATVSGGDGNVASGTNATVGGGSFNLANGDGSTICGGNANQALSGGSTIGGGTQNTTNGGGTIAGGFLNIILAGAGSFNNTIGGGQENTAGGGSATVSGGSDNTANALRSTVGGGTQNVASGANSVVAGGGGFFGGSPRGNSASNTSSTVGGGSENAASGSFSTVPGGGLNTAAGSYSLAAGRRAKANNNGSFVWGDSTDADIASTTDNQFTARASGGVRFFSDAALSTGVELAAGSGSWTSVSDRNLKENFLPVDGRAALKKVASIPILTWNYMAQDDSIRHIGPMAQDIHAAFGVGEKETAISVVDADGVALAAIQGLNQIVEEKDSRISELEAENARIKDRLARIEMLLARINDADGGAK